MTARIAKLEEGLVTTESKATEHLLHKVIVNEQSFLKGGVSVRVV